jgi:hypothetical protein
MATDYDATEFVDDDFQSHQSGHGSSPGSTGKPGRAPTREETESTVVQKQQELAELNRKKDELERERSALEETRRRQAEFHTGRQEMVENLTRGVGLLEASEFSARQEAEQMSKALAGLREALAKVQVLREEAWTQDTFKVELTRALTTIEHARMEWNGARLKFPLLSGQTEVPGTQAAANEQGLALLSGKTFGELWRLGLALTWPLAVLGFLALAALIVVLLLRR